MVPLLTKSRQEKIAFSGRKTASGSSGKNPNKRTYRLGPEALKTCRENWPTPTAIASGVSVYGFRYYDPVTGRWPSRDPLYVIGATVVAIIVVIIFKKVVVLRPLPKLPPLSECIDTCYCFCENSGVHTYTVPAGNPCFPIQGAYQDIESSPSGEPVVVWKTESCPCTKERRLFAKSCGK